MKVNKKALQLIDKGLSSKTVSKLTESQIDVLHSKLLGEQVTEVPSKTTYKVGPKGGSLPPNQKGYSVRQDPNTKEVIATAAEGELGEDDDFDLDADQAYTGQQGSHDEYQAADDGMDDDTSPENHDSKMIGMSEEKDNQPNPWAICHSQVGPKKSRKWERCVREVKKQLKEGKNPVSLFLETQIERIVEKHIPPRITKGDLIKVLSESEPAIAPTKPKTKPDTKPNTKPNRPAHPGKNPNPGENPAPKAKKSETKENSPAPTTKPAPTKPGTKPDTRPRPSHPGKNPNPGENPAPKAKKVSPEDAKDKVIDVIMNLLEK
jgi:hypothetical protein